jgi:glycosyltransferase A (GT-A) superfamily protein (DUF2064 family)
MGRDIGMTTAAWWFRHQVVSILRRLRDPRWEIILAVSPDREGLASRVWHGKFPRLPQGHGDLGARMSRIFRTNQPGPTLIMGADIPGVTKPAVWKAFMSLGRADAVIGPATDGGYWLIGWCGVRPFPPGTFSNVRWSSPHALDDTLRGLDGCRVAYTETLRDVDTARDLAEMT